MTHRRLVVRAGLVLVLTTGSALLLGRLLVAVLLEAAPAAGRSGPTGLDAWVGTAAAAAALAALAWWATAFTVAVVAEARAAIRPGRPAAAPPLPARARVPSGVRRVAAVALGVALTAAPVAAHAAVDRPAVGSVATSGWSADRPADRSADRPPDRPAEGTGGRPAVLVRPGDTLWSLAAARLGGGHRPDPRAVAAAWPGWWRANRAVVGPDPDLIRPGQVLHPPTDAQEDR